jgi:Flp pilus assembly protein TadG
MRTDGAAMIEFAFVLPFLLIIIWGIIDISRMFEAVNSLASAVREGARAAAVVAPSDTGDVARSNIKAIVAARFAVVGGPLDTSQVQVVWNAPQDSVTANYRYQALTPMLWAFQISRTAAFRWEQAATAP